MEQGLIADTVRGPHSTGMYWVDKKDQAYYHKELGDGYNFVTTGVFQRATSLQTKAKFFCGHNRYATKGKITVDNAHPFSHHGVTGVHNGTLTSYVGLQAPPAHKGTVSSAFGTDSETVMYSLAVSTDPKKVIEALEGAFVLVWHDMEDNCVRMVRNNKRPLWLAKLKHRNTVVFASERMMLEWLVDRNKASIEHIEALPVGEVWRFDLSAAPAKRIKPFVQKVNVKKTYTQNYGNYGGYSGWPHHGNRVQGRSGQSTGNSSSTSTSGGSQQSSTMTSPGNKALPNNVTPINNRQRETVGEFLRRHSIEERAPELYGEVIDIKTTASTFRVVCLCEQGGKPFSTVTFLPRNSMPGVTEEFLQKELLCITGIPVSVEPDVLGEPALILNIQSACAIDHEWNLLYGNPEHMTGTNSKNVDWKKKSQAVLREKLSKLESEFYQGKSESASGPALEVDPDDEDETLAGERLVVGPEGEYIPYSEWMELTKEGCSCCHQTIRVEDAELVEWDGTEADPRPTCHHCQDLDFANRSIH